MELPGEISPIIVIVIGLSGLQIIRQVIKNDFEIMSTITRGIVQQEVQLLIVTTTKLVKNVTVV